MAACKFGRQPLLSAFTFSVISTERSDERSRCLSHAHEMTFVGFEMTDSLQLMEWMDRLVAISMRYLSGVLNRKNRSLWNKLMVKLSRYSERVNINV